MEMQVERKIDAPRAQVWAALNDVEVLKASIPGCESFVSDEENTFKAQITAKVGPVKAKFKFNVSLTELDPPNGYTINGEGQGGAAGFANGSAVVSLKEDGNQTLLAYHAKVNVGGKLAQLGGRLIGGTAQKMANEFFATFSELAANPNGTSNEEDTENVAPAPTEDENDQGTPIWLWGAGLVVLAAIAFGVMS